MVDKFLKAKHWQLFLLTVGIPMIFQFAMMGTMFSNFGSANPDPTYMFNYMLFFPIMMILFLGVFFGWFWSIVTGLQKVIPEELRMKLTRFKVFLVIPLVYVLFFSILIGGVLSRILDSAITPDPEFMAGMMAIIFPLHLFSMFCMFHTLYFVAKAFKTAELKRNVSFSDFAGEFFLIWFYPIGIWVVQPKINKMVKG